MVEEEIDENYEPTEAEIVEYAKRLGLVRASPAPQPRPVVIGARGNPKEENALLLFAHAAAGVGRTWRQTKSCSGWRARG